MALDAINKVLRQVNFENALKVLDVTVQTMDEVGSGLKKVGEGIEIVSTGVNKFLDSLKQFEGRFTVILQTTGETFELIDNYQLSGSDKAHRIGTNLGVIISESAVIIAELNPDVSNETKLKIKVSRELAHLSAHISRKISKRDLQGKDFVEVADDLVFRSLDLLKTPAAEEKIRKFIKNHEVFQRFIRGRQYVEQLQVNLRTSLGIHAGRQGVQTPQVVNPQPVNAQLNREDLRTYNTFEDLLHLNNTQDLRRIPNILAASFQGFPQCPITGQPIRFLVQLRDPDLPPIYYEQEALFEWMATHPEGIPPGWIEDLPFVRGEVTIEENVEEQNRIDQHLLRIIEGLREDLL